MILSVFVAIASTYLPVAALPGANFLVVSQIGLTMSRAHALSAAIGVAGGAAVLSAVALAVGHRLASSQGVLLALNLCFVLALGYVGVRLLIGSALAEGAAFAPVMSRLACFRLGLVTAATNPVTATLFLTMVAAPDCRSGSCGPLVGAMAVFTVACVWFSAVAIIFSGARLKLRFNCARPWFNILLGSALIALASNAYFAIPY